MASAATDWKTIQDQIDEGKNTIYLGNDTYTGSSQINVNKDNIVFYGGNNNVDGLKSTLNGENNKRIMYVTGSNITFIGINFINGYGNQDGGAFYIEPSCSIIKWDNCTFENNTASRSGGAIASYAINNSWVDCTFTNNRLGSNGGGAIYLGASSSSNWTNCKFNMNYGPNGGAIMAGSNNIWKNCEFDNNKGANGGAIQLRANSNNHFINCNFTNNNATGSGGAIYFVGSSNNNNWTDCNFNDNYASAAGAIYFYAESNYNTWNDCNFTNNTGYHGSAAGAIYIKGSYNSWDNCKFDNNKAIRAGPKNNINGGAISIGGSHNKWNNSIFINHSAVYGGAIYFFSGSDFTLTNCRFIDNQAISQGGALFFEPINNVSYMNCTFKNNKANSVNGGAIYAQGSYNNWTDCNFIGNNATGNGGAIYIDLTSNNEWNNCKFINNTAETVSGGAIYIAKGSNNNWSNCNLIGNNATGDGGAIYFNTGTVNNTWVGCNFRNNNGRNGVLFIAAQSISNFWRNCNFTDNQATADGGVIFAGANSNPSFENCLFSNNNAGGLGGVMRLGANNAHCSWDNCNFTCNRAKTGGVLYVYDNFNNNTFENCIFSNNTASANVGGGVFYITSGSSNEWNNCNFSGNNATGNGGVIHFQNAFNNNWTNCNFTNNIVTVDGGAIYVNGGSNNIWNNCNFTNNIVTVDGGAIYVMDGSNNNWTNCNFENCSANVGGAIYLMKGTNNHLIKSSFNNNKATCSNNYGGGAICINSGSKTKFFNCNFTTNNGYSAGAIYLYSTCNYNEWNNCNFICNKATTTGGAISFTTLSINNKWDNCTFTNNTATTHSGAIYFDSGSNNKWDNCKFTANKATNNNGGAIFFNQDSDSNSWTNCTFTKNTAKIGGGAICFNKGSNNNWTNCNFINNTAINNGGAISTVASSNYNWNNCSFFNNKATEGGAIHTTGSKFNATYCIFEKNTAGDGNSVYDGGSSNDFNNNFWGTINNITSAEFNALKLINNPVDNIVVVNITKNNNGYEVYFFNNKTKEKVTMPDYTANVTIADNSTNQHIEDSVSAKIKPCDIIKVNSLLTNNLLAIFIPKNVTVNSANVTIIYGKNATIEISLNETSATGNVTLKINNKEFKGNLTNGKVNITIPTDTWASGVYNFNITYSGDILFTNTTSNNYKLNITKASVNITSYDVNITYGQNAKITIKLNDTRATGNITVNINNKTFKGVLNNNGEVNITITSNTWNSANYTFNITYEGDGNFTSALSDNYKLTINKTNVTVNSTSVTIIYGQNAIITVKVKDTRATGNVTVTINNKTFKGVLNNEGEVNVTITCNTWNSANYTFNITYEGDGNFTNALSDNYKLTINKTNVTVNSTNTTSVYGQNATITVKVNDTRATGNVTVTINSQTFDGILNNDGMATIKINSDKWNAGNYTFTVKYNGDGNFTSATNTTHYKLTITQADVTVNSTNATIIYGQNATITVKVNDTRATGNITVTINSQTFKGILNNTGVATIKINSDKWNAGNYTFTVKYNGDGNFTSATNTTNYKLTITQADVTVNSTNASIVYGHNATITVKVNDTRATGNVTVTFDGQSFDGILDNDGVATIKINSDKWSTGNYSFTVKYNGDGNFTSVSNTTNYKLTITQADVTVNSTDATSVYGHNATITVKVNDTRATGNITITINSQTFKGILNNDGVATIKINSDKWSTGNYSFTVSYNGDGNFTSVSNTTNYKLTITQADVTVNSTDATSVYGHNATITVKVNDTRATGNVTVTFDGQSFNGILDNTGVATIKINSDKWNTGDYTFTVKYNGDSNFTSVSNTTIYKLTITPSSITVNSTSVTIIYCQNATIKINVNDTRATGNLTIQIKNHDDITVLLNNKMEYIVSIDSSSWNSGVYDFNITYNGDKNFAISVSDNYILNITQADVNIDIIANPIVYSENATVKVDLGDKRVTGTVTVTINGTTKTMSLVNGSAVFVYTDLPAGVHNIGVSYSGDGNYKSNQANGSLTVNKKDFVPSVDVSDIYYGDNATITVNYIDTITGDVIITVNGKNKTLINHKITFDGLDVGSYNVYVYYKGDNNYNEYNNTSLGSFIVKKLIPHPSVEVDPVLSTYNDTNNVTITVTIGDLVAGGSVNITVNGTTKNIAVNYGVAKCNFTGLPAGNHTVYVVYSGDATHESFSNSMANLTITKASVNATVGITSITYGNNGTVTVKLNNPDATGLVNVTVNNKTITKTMNAGETLTFTFENLASGFYPVTVSFKANDTSYKDIDPGVYGVLVVDKARVSPSTTVSNIVFGDNETVTISFKNDLNVTGTVNITINGTSKIVNIINAVANATFDKLGAGKYTVTIIYNGDNNHYTDTFVTNFTVSKADVSVNVTGNPNPTEYNPNNNITITVDFNDLNVTGTVDITVNGITKEDISIVDGKALVNFTALSVGSYDVTVSYSGDNNHNPIDPVVKTTLIVNKCTPSINVDPVAPVNYTEPVTLNIHVSDNTTTGVVNITVNGVTKSVHLVNGVASVTYDDLPAGTYYITVSYSGDGNHNNNSKIITEPIVVNKIAPIISVSAPSITEGRAASITVDLPANACGTVNITVNSNVYYANISNGKAVFTIKGLSKGNYPISVYFPGDGNYTDSSASCNLTVKKRIDPVPPTVVSFDIDSVGDNLIITVNPTTATGNITVDINGKTYTGEIVDGSMIIEGTGLDNGNYTAHVSYYGDGRYAPVVKDVNFTIDKIQPEIIVPTVISKGDNLTVKINPADATGTITVTINGKNYTAEIKDGIAQISIDQLDSGNYTVKVTYSGDGYYAPVISEANFTVMGSGLVFVGSDVYKYYHGSERYIVHLLNDGKGLVNEKITVSVNGKSYTAVTDENGIASIAINLNPGNYTITATWKNLTVKNTVIVKSTIHCDDFTKYYLNGTQYIADVFDSEGNPLDGVDVTFNIHGVFYTRTVHNGTVKMNINLLPGEYIITAYNGVTGEASSAIVKVLPTLVGNNLNMTYQDGSKYECKLVDGQGNPIKDVELTFNIHGVFYNKLTDDDGIARLNINLFPGEYIITAIYDELTMTSNIITVRD